MSLSPYSTSHQPAGTVVASGVTQTFDLPTRGRESLIVAVDVTAIGAVSLTVSILGVLPVSGKTYVILAGAAISTVSTQVLQVSPGMVGVANLVANAVLPATVRISIAHSTANAATFSVESQLTVQ